MDFPSALSGLNASNSKKRDSTAAELHDTK